MKYMRVMLRRRFKIKGVICIALIVIGTILLELTMQSQMKRAAETIIKNNAISIINETVLEILKDETNESLISYTENINGDITAIKTNAVKINILKEKIIREAILRFNNSDAKRIRVPIGSLTKSIWLQGKGPIVNVNIKSVNNFVGRMISSFTDAGINQTKHSITLILNTQFGYLIGGKYLLSNLDYEVLICETVIVCDVPESAI